MKFEIFRGKGRQWYAHLKARNGEIIAASEGYQRSNGAMKWVRLVQGSDGAPVIRPVRRARK